MSPNAAPKHVVFDVVGTCVSYQVWFDAIAKQLGPRFAAQEPSISPQLFAFAWMEAAEREYTYLSISGRYKVFSAVQSALFYRMLYQSGIAEPRKFANDEDLKVLMDAYSRLEMREGVVEAFQKLRGAGWTVWALTAGDVRRVGGYFKAAGLDMPAENLLSCDSSGVGKPDLKAYRPAMEKLESIGGEKWFAAAHMWDVSAAKQIGFKGAYTSVWEKEPCTELFGEMDVMAETPLEMAEKMIAATS
ncbi:HAD-like protein [Saccharata proteae CBS 121410]|uniref:HAD-like protein n=1 Tax=Saccharata proteae CBS 121410 TaxID=1314787 RepID=A0A9P4I0E6_9PEZI|nr:HAD-like protein [Saccharata proteae CBS 121410]